MLRGVAFWATGKTFFFFALMRRVCNASVGHLHNRFPTSNACMLTSCSRSDECQQPAALEYLFQINSVFSPGSVSTCDCVKMCLCSGLVLQPADVVGVNLTFPCSRRCEPLGKCYSGWLTNCRNLSEKSFTCGFSSKICVFFQLKKQTINWFQNKSIKKKSPVLNHEM